MSTAGLLIDVWAHWAGSSLWQVTWLVAALIVLDLFLRRRGWPQLRMALWMLVSVRLVLPPGIGSPLDLTSDMTVAAPPTSATVAVGSVPAAVFPLTELLCAAWLLGAVCLLLAGWRARRLAVRHVLSPNAVETAPEWLAAAAAKCARRLGLRATPRVVCTHRVAGAAVVGVLRPVIAVSAGFLRTASRSDVEHVLLHELAHLRRRDPLQRVVLEVLRALYWFHPAVWLAVRRIEDLREVCCDATVASVLRTDTAAYRNTLLRAGRALLEEPVAGGTLGWSARPSQLMTRLAWLEAPTWERPARRRAATVAALALLLAFAMPTAPGRTPIALAPAATSAAHVPRDSAASELRPTPDGVATAKRLLSRVDDVHGRPGTHQLRAAAAYLIWAGEFDSASGDD